jgi:hypothetical protein
MAADTGATSLGLDGFKKNIRRWVTMWRLDEVCRTRETGGAAFGSVRLHFPLTAGYQIPPVASLLGILLPLLWTAAAKSPPCRLRLPHPAQEHGVPPPDVVGRRYVRWGRGNILSFPPEAWIKTSRMTSVDSGAPLDPYA